LAFDLGAESGRAMLGRFDGARLSLHELHRFANGAVRVRDSLHWDVLRLFGDIKHGLTLASQHAITSIGLDAWGVDFALLDRDDHLIGNPFHYRDRRTDGMMLEAFRVVPRPEIFAQTGVQFMPINTLYQLLAMSRAQSPALQSAATLLMMPDLFNFWLTGRKVSEFTIASTTQCYNPRERRWATTLLERLHIPSHIMPEIVPPATTLGALLPSVAAETGLHSVHVIAPACHDTAAAVAAVPTPQADFAYISSGTWSLMGVEVAAPIITAASLAHNFTNEGGIPAVRTAGTFGGTFRFLKNIMGLWLVQECRRAWARANVGAGSPRPYKYDELTRLAAAAPPLVSLIDPDDERFLHPDDMPAAIRAYCAQSQQAVPDDHGAVVRCALESLALKYRWTLERIEEMVGRRVNAIHIVGGGAQNRLLCQWTADATGRLVMAGPSEATAIGNIVVQLIARGQLASLAEGRGLVRRSFDLTTYEPRAADAWHEAYARWLKLSRVT
ncbi:MAG: rhamnulokinase family protein, partial [Chloroflexota bacterium]